MGPLLALFIRSLREDLRGHAIYLLRSGLVILILFFLWQTHQMQRWSGAVGRNFFTSVLWIDLFILAVVGLSYFASAIAEEKEESTLGLLRMTDLSALAILLGKSTSRMCGALLLIAAQLPFMLLAVTMGGLDIQQVLAGFALLLSSTFLIANLALIGSVTCARTASATGFTAITLAVFAFAPGLLDFDAHAYDHSDEWLGRSLQGWVNATPTFRLRQITTTGFHDSVIGWHFAANLLLGGVCFLVAWALFDRGAESDGEPDSSLLPAASANATIHRYGRPGEAALSWKDFHFIAGGYRGMIIKGILATLLLLLFLSGVGSFDRARALEQIGVPLFSAGALSLVLSLAFSASRIFKSERRDQTLTDLATLPCSMSRIVWQKVRGCLAADWPLCSMMIVGALLTLPALVRSWFSYPRSLPQNIAMWCCFAISAVQLPLSIAWISLRVRWGALPLGLTAWFLGNWLSLMLAIVLFNEGSMVVLPLAGMVVAGMLAANIPRRLEKLSTGE